MGNVEGFILEIKENSTAMLIKPDEESAKENDLINNMQNCNLED